MDAPLPPSDDFGLVDYESPKVNDNIDLNPTEPMEEEPSESQFAEVELMDEEHVIDEPAEAQFVKAEHTFEPDPVFEPDPTVKEPSESQLVEAEATFSSELMGEEPIGSQSAEAEHIEAEPADENGSVQHTTEHGNYEPESAMGDSNQLIDYDEEADFNVAEVAAFRDKSPSVPEAWVYSEGEWMIYLGPDQSSFDFDYQMELYTMPLVQLIDALHTDILLREDTELALEFPSLGLVIDRRDDACIDLSLQQLYNYHVAAVAMGTISVDLVYSPYFAHTPTESKFTPSHESFAFIIHTRPSVQTTLARIMQVVEEYNNKELESTVPDSPHAEVPDEEQVEEEDQQQQNGHHDEQQTDTAKLLAENDYEEDEDEDFVADEEEEGDHVLDDDAVDEEEVEEEEEEDEEPEDEEEEEAETHVESAAASPARKRTTDEFIDLVDIEDEEGENSEPVAKKPKSEDDESAAEVIHVDS
ncbi:hypothetical protein EV178_001287 [Coemansia sp. RSA 1646]|nr:hypothetical protein EV178_001287 [Coemansia sp. RSA 1646]